MSKKIIHQSGDDHRHENDAGHNQRIKEFGSLITPEIKTKVSQVFSVYGIKPRLVSIVINKKGNIEATEWIFHEK